MSIDSILYIIYYIKSLSHIKVLNKGCVQASGRMDFAISAIMDVVL
jgi:hypothetical protein